jgi:hypothetical protein
MLVMCQEGSGPLARDNEPIDGAAGRQLFLPHRRSRRAVLRATGHDVDVVSYPGKVLGEPR